MEVEWWTARTTLPASPGSGAVRPGAGCPTGELTGENESAWLFSRLTFNPFPKDLTTRIDRFFESIE